MTAAMLLAFDDEAPLAHTLADAMQLPLAFVQRHRFPDGELKLTLPPSLPGHVALLRSLHQPNEKLIEVWLAAHGARALGARHCTLLAPYLAYMRQDIAFTPGEVVSQRIVGRLLAECVDALVTVDPHLHRVSSLAEAIPVPDAIALSAAPTIGAFLKHEAPDALLLGPDEESAQWVARAALGGQTHAVCTKVRHGDHEVSITLPPLAFEGRRVVLIDDVASTGKTLIEAARLLKTAGASRVDVAVTHALLAGDAEDALYAGGISQLWSADSIAHASNAFTLAPLIADAFETIVRRRSQGD